MTGKKKLLKHYFHLIFGQKMGFSAFNNDIIFPEHPVASNQIKLILSLFLLFISSIAKSIILLAVIFFESYNGQCLFFFINSVPPINLLIIRLEANFLKFLFFLHDMLQTAKTNPVPNTN